MEISRCWNRFLVQPKPCSVSFVQHRVSTMLMNNLEAKRTFSTSKSIQVCAAMQVPTHLWNRHGWIRKRNIGFKMFQVMRVMWMFSCQVYIPESSPRFLKLLSGNASGAACFGTKTAAWHVAKIVFIPRQGQLLHFPKCYRNSQKDSRKGKNMWNPNPRNSVIFFVHPFGCSYRVSISLSFEHIFNLFFGQVSGGPCPRRWSNHYWALGRWEWLHDDAPMAKCSPMWMGPWIIYIYIYVYWWFPLYIVIIIPQ